MRKLIFCLMMYLFLAAGNANAQNNVGIGTTTPNASSILELQSTNQGMLVPRMTTAQRLAIVTPANGLLVFDTNVGCFFFFDTPGATWQNLCSGGGSGVDGIDCWDLNGNGVNDAAEDVNGDGSFNAIDCKGTAGTTGPAGAAGPAGATGATGPAGPAGATGPAGPTGLNGTNGANGINGTNGANGVNCWDTNGNGVNDASEDVNGDGSFNTLDCAGAAGMAGPAGPAGSNGTNGFNCWDTNGNGTNDASEDVNGDGSFNTLDCAGAAGATGPAGAAGATGPAGAAGATGATGAAGPAGATGATGPAGPTGPTGIINRYHVYGNAGRVNVTSATHTMQPGMTQTFTVGATSTVIVWATIGGLNTSTATGSFSTVDMVVYLDGAFLPNGGWNRFTVGNPTGTNAFNTCAINTMFTVPAGTHTIDLRTARAGGTLGTSVSIGGNAALDTNPGELTILIIN